MSVLLSSAVGLSWKATIRSAPSCKRIPQCSSSSLGLFSYFIFHPICIDGGSKIFTANVEQYERNLFKINCTRTPFSAGPDDERRRVDKVLRNDKLRDMIVVLLGDNLKEEMQKIVVGSAVVVVLLPPFLDDIPSRFFKLSACPLEATLIKRNNLSLIPYLKYRYHGLYD